MPTSILNSYLRSTLLRLIRFSFMNKSPFACLVSLLPLNILSAAFGFIAHLKLPHPLSRIVVRAFVNYFHIDLKDATKKLDEFQSIGEVFMRELVPGARSIGEGLVSPVDGVLREYGKIENGSLPQIKGKTYSVEEFLGSSSEAKRFEGGTFFNLYLSPPDYHAIHSPLDGDLGAATYIPGRLWPVNDWAMNNVPNLFSVNERVVCYLESALGRIAVVMVGATNVGKISVTFDSFLTNKLFRPANSTTHLYPQKPHFQKGDKLGCFHFGSTVVMLLPPDAPRLKVLIESGKVSVGTPLAHF